MENNNKLTEEQRNMLAKLKLVCEDNKEPRFIALVGTGGTGKTHFAQTAAYLALNSHTVIVHQISEMSEKQHKDRFNVLISGMKHLPLVKKPVKLTKPKTLKK